MSHPYVEHEGRAIWRALDAALAELESNGDLQLTTARRYVAGYLCQRLDRLGVLTWTLGAAAALAPEAAVAWLTHSETLPFTGKLGMAPASGRRAVGFARDRASR